MSYGALSQRQINVIFFLFPPESYHSLFFPLSFSEAGARSSVDGGESRTADLIEGDQVQTRGRRHLSPTHEHRQANVQRNRNHANSQRRGVYEVGDGCGMWMVVVECGWWLWNVDGGFC